ncbi:Gfo/Idh/MocA family protein [Pseudomonas sp. Marseille-Q8238]
MNVCMVGHGMMGVWHSEALQGADCCLHTVVGRRPEPTAEFAARFGYRKWTVSYEQALADPEVEVVIIAGPSETHAEMATAALMAGKHTLVEIPLAMCQADAERVVALAEARGLTLGVVHPMRFRRERDALMRRVAAGEETVSHAHGRFFIQRRVNIGATGYKRSWVDNLLWHHTTHLLDIGLWTLSGGDMRNVESRVRSIRGLMPACDPHTGIPMELVLSLDTHDDQSLACIGSYYGHEYLYDTLTVTDRNSYRLDERSATLATASGVQPIDSEQHNAWQVPLDFIAALHQGREPKVPGWSVLPTMRLLQQVQDQWDAIHGRQPLPGRPQY